MLVDPRRAFPVESSCSSRAEFYQSGMVLTKIITDAKTKITGTPVKFDPKVMMQQRMQQRQQQQNPCRRGWW